MSAVVSPATRGFQKRFDRLQGEASGSLLELRRQGWDRFEALGFPGRKQEAWRDVNLTGLQRLFAEAPNALPAVEPGTPCADLGGTVVLLGAEPTPTLPKGASLTPIAADAVPEGFGRLAGVTDHPFNALNTALFGGALHLKITASLEAPLHLVYSAPSGDGPVSVHPRLFVEVAPQVECILVEDFAGTEGDGFLNPVTEVSLGQNSRLHHHRVVARGGGGWHIGSVAVAAHRDALYQGTSVVLEGGLVRVDVNVALKEPGAEVNLFGVFATDDSQVVDHHTHITHAVADTRSRQLYRGILGGKSRGVFNGRITIAEDAQRVSADQVNNNLLLSDRALVNSNPQLEIFADDVSCRHGATIGQLDPAKVFYLCSRGIPRETARALLTQAFLDEVLEDMQPEALHAYIQENIRARFFAGV